MSSANISRRAVLKGTATTAAAGVAASALRAGAAAAAEAPASHRTVAPASTGLFEAKKAAGGHFRYWWPGAGVTPAQVAAEVDAMADAGFGGFEIADVRNNETEYMDPKIYGWGSPNWIRGVEAALERALVRGLRVDLTMTPFWPAIVPGLLPDDTATMKELTYGQAIVSGGSTLHLAVPAPHSIPSGLQAANIPPVKVTPILEAVHAAKIVGSSTATPLVLDQSSLTDVTSHVADGTLNWTVPAGSGEWVIIASYSRGTAMTSTQIAYQGFIYWFTSPPGYVIDYFSTAGNKALTHYWDADLLTPTIRTLLRKVGDSFFDDSLEFVTELHWTPKMLAEFKNRRGYDLKPYLPLVQSQSSPVFVFADAATSDRIRWDYFQTLSDLWMDHHDGVINPWAERLGMTFRNQPYGAPLDLGLAMATAGTPEGETLGFITTPDSFRVAAAGRDLGGRSVILSSETGARLYGSFGPPSTPPTTTATDDTYAGGYRMRIVDMLSDANYAYSLGVNQHRFHGFPYATSPIAEWPGFFPWAPLPNAPINFGEAWAPREPQWQFMETAGHYVARANAALQTGVEKTDLAIYREEFDATTTQFDGAAVTDAGFNYHLLTWGLLSLPATKVTHRRLATAGPDYKALIISDQPHLLLSTAKTLLSWARAGLPIVIIGDLAQATPDFREASTQDAALAATLSKLLKCASVQRIDTPARLPATLHAAGITASAVPTGVSGLIHVRRVNAHGTYYFVRNPGTATVTGTLQLEGAGNPFHIDLWTGAVEPIASSRRTRTSVTVPVSLTAGEGALYLLNSSRSAHGSTAPDRYVVSSTAPVITATSGLAVRASRAGTYTAVTDNGRKLTAKVPDLPAPISVDQWQLDVQDWQPKNPGATGAPAPATIKSTHKIGTVQPGTWQAIDGLADVSGIGTYTATLTLPAAWKLVSGTVLSLGSVGAGSAGVKVNGRWMKPINQFTATVDLGPALRPGNNTIVVTVATTLINRLRVTRPTDFTAARQDYGLLGPVTLEPYALIQLD